MTVNIARVAFSLGLASLIVAPSLASPGRRIEFDKKCNVTSFYSVPIDLTIGGLKRLPYRVHLDHVTKEGDRYTTARIRAKDGVDINVEFVRARLYRAETSSRNAVAPRGVKIGSSLADVKKAWPNGKLIYGIGERRFYVTYLTGTNVLFDFDPEEMPATVFNGATIKETEIPNIRVRNIRIENISVGARATGGVPKPPCNG